MVAVVFVYDGRSGVIESPASAIGGPREAEGERLYFTLDEDAPADDGSGVKLSISFEYVALVVHVDGVLGVVESGHMPPNTYIASSFAEAVAENDKPLDRKFTPSERSREASEIWDHVPFSPSPSVTSRHSCGTSFSVPHLPVKIVRSP